jgi:hypothetical protein
MRAISQVCEWIPARTGEMELCNCAVRSTRRGGRRLGENIGRWPRGRAANKSGRVDSQAYLVHRLALEQCDCAGARMSDVRWCLAV